MDHAEHHREPRQPSLPEIASRWIWSLPVVIEPDPLEELDLPLPLRCLLARRGLTHKTQAMEWLEPKELPDPLHHFPELFDAVERVAKACENGESVAICGDYDADGMTSTALLLRALTPLGAKPTHAIPSRTQDGYGLNAGMVQRLHDDGIRLLITVDNGVSAQEGLELAHELGVEVIVTDHHTIPDQRPPMKALIHPATTPPESPYRGLAGVGLAYVLALVLAERLQRLDVIAGARDLFCIGTVADMAPLTGANRLWLQEGLKHLHQSGCEGLRALQRLAGLGDRALKAEDIGFQIAPRINAVGRLGEPRLVVDLLTEANADAAMGLARRCDDYNRQRRDLCDAIEAEALALVEADEQRLPPFLLLAQAHWHHGVIGIVAARLVERYHRPTALLAGEGQGRLRASVRAPIGFAVDAALEHCGDLLERFGGHPAAGGFSISAEKVSTLHERLNVLADGWLETQGLGIPVRPEVLLGLKEVDWDLWAALQRLEPFGMGHQAPLFWARDCEVVHSQNLTGGHLRLVLQQGDVQRGAIAWRWDASTPVPEHCDVAFRVMVNRWQGEQRLQLEVKALRHHSSSIGLKRGEQRYVAFLQSETEFILRNNRGQEILATVVNGSQLQCFDPLASHPQVKTLLEEASLGLGLRP